MGRVHPTSSMLLVGSVSTYKYCYITNNGHVCIVKHSICFVDAWARSNKPETQSIYRGDVNPSPQSTHNCVTRFGEDCKTTMPSSGWCMLLHKVQHAMDVLPSIPYILWVHGQGMTSLKHNQYTGVLSIQPLGTHAVGPDLVRTAKQPCHPQGGVCCYTKNNMPWIFSHPFLLWVHGQGLTSLGHNQYTVILFIQIPEHPSCGTRFGENCKNTMPSSGWCYSD